jgi:hypothetical protein
MAKKVKPAPEPVEEVFPCEFCKKEFKTELGFLNHMCERKRRWMWRNERYIRIGFTAFQLFYSLSLKAKKPKTYEEFMNSNYFTVFTKFGRYVEHINAIESHNFTEFLIKRNVRIDDWTKEAWYEEWIRELTRREEPMKAVERNILLMEQWGREHDENWIDFFRKVPTPKATEWIRKGRISPWLLYCGVGQSLFDRMSDEQLGLVKEWINPLYWTAKIRDRKEEVDQIKTILREAGV